MDHDGCAVLLLASLLALALLLGGGIGYGVGKSDAIRDVACPALLTNSRTLADSLSVAKQYDECEWWTTAAGGE